MKLSTFAILFGSAVAAVPGVVSAESLRGSHLEEDAFFANKDRSDCWRLGPQSRDRLGCNGSANDRNNYRPRSSNSSSSSNKRNCRLVKSKSTCNSSRNCEWVVNKGRMAPHCAHRNYEDALYFEDVFSEFEDYMNDEDSEEFEFESEDIASEDFAFNERSSDFFSGSKKNNCKLIKSKRTCNSSRHCKWLEAGRMMPRCARLHYEDVFSESDDYMKDEDMEE